MFRLRFNFWYWRFINSFTYLFTYLHIRNCNLGKSAAKSWRGKVGENVGEFHSAGKAESLVDISIKVLVNVITISDFLLSVRFGENHSFGD